MPPYRSAVDVNGKPLRVGDLVTEHATGVTRIIRIKDGMVYHAPYAGAELRATLPGALERVSIDRGRATVRPVSGQRAF